MSSDSTIAQEAEQLKVQGNECFRRRLYNKSVYFYTRAIELAPENSVLWANRAQSYLNLHKPEKAFTDASGAIQRDSNNHKALFRRAHALCKLGLRARARSDALKCAELEPQNPGVRELLEQLQGASDTPAIDLTVFQRPEPLQSNKPLAKKQIHLCK